MNSRIVQRDGMYWQSDEPPFRLPKVEPPQDRAWDWPLTPAVLCVIAGAVAFVVMLAVAGWLT